MSTLTRPLPQAHDSRQELDNSSLSGPRTRQTCGFFVHGVFTPSFPRFMPGVDGNKPLGVNTVRRLSAVVKLPAPISMGFQMTNA